MAGRILRPEVRSAVEALISAQVRPAQIALTLSVKFNLSVRQIHRYHKRIFEELAAEAEKERPLRKHQLRQTLRAVIAKAFQLNKLAVVIMACDRLAKLDGLYEREQFEVVVNNVALMTSGQQRKRLLELATKAGVPRPGSNGHDEDSKHNGSGGALS